MNQQLFLFPDQDYSHIFAEGVCHTHPIPQQFLSAQVSWYVCMRQCDFCQTLSARTIQVLRLFPSLADFLSEHVVSVIVVSVRALSRPH